MTITWNYIDGKGRGVIASADIAKGEVVERSPINPVSQEDAETRALDHLHFGWGLNEEDKDRSGGCCIGFGYLSLYNHSDNPNAEYIRHYSEHEMSIVALREIKVNEEVTINYGVPLWFEPRRLGGKEGDR